MNRIIMADLFWEERPVPLVGFDSDSDDPDPDRTVPPMSEPEWAVRQALTIVENPRSAVWALRRILDVFNEVRSRVHATDATMRRLMRFLVNARAKYGQRGGGLTPLITAVIANDVGVAATLVRMGARVDRRDRVLGYSPLMHAVVRRTNGAMVRLLLINGASVSFRAFDGNTPLTLAVAQSCRPSRGRVARAGRADDDDDDDDDDASRADSLTHAECLVCAVFRRMKLKLMHAAAVAQSVDEHESGVWVDVAADADAQQCEATAYETRALLRAREALDAVERISLRRAAPLARVASLGDGGVTLKDDGEHVKKTPPTPPTPPEAPKAPKAPKGPEAAKTESSYFDVESDEFDRSGPSGPSGPSVESDPHEAMCYEAAMRAMDMR
jgi:hypothetical protein